MGKDNRKSSNMDTDEKVFLINQNAAFEIKYKGPYGEKLGSKPLSEMTSKEESDASVWEVFYKEVARWVRDINRLAGLVSKEIMIILF